MCFYYYKDGEKIGPVDFDEFDALAQWGDIKPDTVTTVGESGRKRAASEFHSTFGTNPLRISLNAARRLHSVLMSVCFLSALPAVFCSAMVCIYWNSLRLLKIYSVIDLVFLSLVALSLLLDVIFRTKNVPPKYK